MWSIDPKIPMGLWWALLCASAVALVWYSTYREGSISVVRRILITSLLAIGFIGPLLIALNPTWIEPIPPLPGKPLLSILLDGTLSMGTRDEESGKTLSRWERGLQIATQVGPARETLEVRIQGFHDQLMSLDLSPVGLAKLGSDWPKGARSDLAGIVRQSIRKGSPAGHALLLLSDGAHNVGSVDNLLAAAHEASSLDVPIYTMTLGTQVGAHNLALSAATPRMIAFPNNPLTLRVNVGHSGLSGQSTNLTLYVDDRAIQSKSVRLTNEPTQEVRFQLTEPSQKVLERYRVEAQAIQGEATEADNRSTILVQRLDHPVGVLLLEGKPYWDSKFLARNLGRDPVVQLTSVVRLGERRFLAKEHPRPDALTLGFDEANSSLQTETQPPSSDVTPTPTDGNPSLDSKTQSDWEIQREVASPLESAETLGKYRLVILGRDADVYLTQQSIENLRQWISRDGGCLLCARGAPANEIVAKLSEILPIRWTKAPESRFRSKVSQYGFDAAVFEPFASSDGIDPLVGLPSLSTNTIPSPRIGLPQVLVQSVLDASGDAIPVVTYQPYGSGQTIVVEGAGMWRWAFLPPQHAEMDKIYPALWQSLIQWVVSQQDILPGQKIGIRADRATFLAGDRASATILIRSPEEFFNEKSQLDLTVLLESSDLGLPKRLTPSPSGTDSFLFRVDLGDLDVGYYTAKVTSGERDTVLSETAFEVRDPWFERLDVDARPDLMRRIALISGGEVLKPEDAGELVDRFQRRIDANRPQKTTRTSLWDRPLVLLLILGTWMTSWIVRRRNGLV